MSEAPGDTHPLQPEAVPLDEGTDGSRSGVGAQTALLAMIRKRRMRASGEQEPDLPPPELGDPAAE